MYGSGPEGYPIEKNVLVETLKLKVFPRALQFVKGIVPHGSNLTAPRPWSCNFSQMTNSHSRIEFNAKTLGFVQTRDQELPIALFKSIKLRLPTKLELMHIF